MTLFTTATVVGVFVGVVPAQTPAAPQGHEAFLRAGINNSQKVSAQQLMRDAADAGLVQGAAAQRAFKRSLLVLRSKDRAGQAPWRYVDFPAVAAPAPTGADVAAEFESNDGWQYADSMVGETTASGDCSLAGDVDSWRFESAGGFYSILVEAAGATPIADSILYVRNDKGDPVAFNDDSNGALSQIHVYLPTGTYYADVAGFAGIGGGTYDLSVVQDAVAITDIGASGSAAGTTQAPASGATHDVLEFTLTGDSRVDLSLTSGGDTTLVVQRADGVIYFANDESSAGGFDAAADLDLPAGTYYAYVADFFGVGGVTWTASYSASAITMAELCAAGSATGDLAGVESLRLFRVDLQAAQELDALTTDGQATPVGDTVMALHDSDLDFLCDVDDDDTFNPARGNYSRIRMTLPASTYYVAVSPFFSSGDFTVSATCGAAAQTGVANFGAFAGAIAGFGEVSTYALSTCTQTSTRMAADNFFFGLLGPDGQLATATRGSAGLVQAAEVPGGDSTLFAWDRFDFASPILFTTQPALYFDEVAGALSARAKVGDVQVMFARFGQEVPVFNYVAGGRGGTCLPNNVDTWVFDIQVAPATGELVWWSPPATLPPEGFSNLKFQCGDVHFTTGWGTIPAVGTWRNLYAF